jgi:8-oxo-dGTP pyrophosphatase MutT (NUDIX family)
LGFVQRLANNVQLMLRRPLRQQYAALCYRIPKGAREPEILLLTSRETHRWVIPKGWPMEGKKAHAVAEREAYEEAGVKGEVSQEHYGFFDYEKKLRSGLVVTCRVQVHLLKVNKMCGDFPEKDDRELAWVSATEAADRVNEHELKHLILRFGHQFGL